MTIGSPLRGAAALFFLIAVFVAIWSPPASAQRADDIETLLEQADQLTQAGKYREASEITKRLLTETERRFGPGHKNVATTLNNLAELYRFQGRYAEAEPFYDRALAMAEKAIPRDDARVGTMLSNIGQLYVAEGRYAQAEATYLRSLALMEKALGPAHPTLALALNNLADLYREQNRYAEAEPLFKRALAIDEKALPGDQVLGRFLGNLTLLYRAEGRFAEAEPLAKRALAITEKAQGSNHPDVANSLAILAGLYDDEHRFADAEPLFRRALAIGEKALGPDHPALANHLNNLAYLYDLSGRYAEAEPLYQRALAISEKAYGPNHPRVATALSNIAALYRSETRFAEAEPLYLRALAIDEKAFGPSHRQVARHLNNLAFLYSAEGRYAQAEPLFERALAIEEKALGPNHPDVAVAFINLAGIHFRQQDWARSAGFWRRASELIVRRTLRGADNVGASLIGKGTGEPQQYSIAFYDLIKAVYRIAPDAHVDKKLLGETFEAAQWTQSSEAAESLAQMAARGAKGDPKLAALVRERQDLVAEWQKRDAVRSAMVAQPPEARDAAAESANNARLAVIDGRIAAIDKGLAADFPDYAALASPAPLAVAEVQAQLADDEALILILDTLEWKPTPEETFIWVVTKTDARWVRSELGTPALAREVTALRCGLDYGSAWIDGRCSDLLKVSYGVMDYTSGKPLPFDLTRAHQLYEALFGEIEDMVKGKHLLIVPSGALTQLPFQVLVTAPPKAALPPSAAGYRDVSWLARTHDVTILPAVASLKSLRALARQSRADELFVGFGNPLLDGDPARFPDSAERASLAREKRCAPSPRQHVAALSALGGASRVIDVIGTGFSDVATIRRQMPLPETADELCEVAADLGVEPMSHVFLGATATESTVKRLSANGTLAKYKIVHFATHAALAGQLSSKAEPGLLLTPPEKPSDYDDGYLTASEVAALKLDAEWVILSACNTAGGEAKGAEALSGLARAFFYAGARSLLVSHWAVASDSTVKLIAKAVAELQANPRIGRAEALRRSMLSLMTTGADVEAHPSFWAPFVLVGEGSATR
jgi:CHAT domain-containing protein/tetratricopeptide (TPR) repeat protein